MEELIGFATGVLFGTAQHLLAVKAFFGRLNSGFAALYIIQLLILSFGFLVAVFFICDDALLPAAVGDVATSQALALIFNLKRFASGKYRD